MLKKNKTLVLIGCGYLGGHIVEQVQSVEMEITALVRSTNRLAGLQRQVSCAKSIDVFSEVIDYQQLCSSPDYQAIFMIPPSAIGEEPGVMLKVVAELCAGNCTSALLISSTGIYGEPENGLVTAETVPLITNKRSKRLATIEDTWLSGGSQFKILRLAGIYGPNRIIGKGSLAEGKVISGNGEAWLNLIHVSDAASLSLRCLDNDSRAVELGADGNPVKREDYYGHVAAYFGYPAPQFSGETVERTTGKPLRNSSSKKCDPSSTFKQLSWSPRFENYRVGLEASIEVARDAEE